jgi:amino acid transporter
LAPSRNRLARLKLHSLIFGHPLETKYAEQHRVGILASIPVFGSSLVSTQGYAPDEMLYVLGGLGAAGFATMMPTTLGVIFLLLSIMLVYRKTIQKYPHGGGSYTIAKQYLGENYGLLAGAGLILDYILTVSVSVSSAVENMTGVFTFLASTNHKVITICAIILFMTIVNLRGLKESAALFALPVYLYLVSIFVLVAVGVYKVIFFGVDPTYTAKTLATSGNGLTVFIFLRALAGGTTALTGIEAVSNGVAAYKAPAQKRAITTLFLLGAIVAVGLSGMSFLAAKYHIIPTSANTAMNQLGLIVFGKGILYYILVACAAVILVIAANTSFAGLPILLNLMAKDGYVPRYFKNLGDRLVFSKGIWVLSAISILLIILFHGNTHTMIPLYAIGVLISFALTGVGLAKHTWHTKGKGWISDFLIFSFGGGVSFLVFAVFLSTKFFEGAWMIVLLLPIMVFFFRSIAKVYQREITSIKVTPEDIKQFNEKIAKVSQRRVNIDLSEYNSKIVVPVFDMNKIVLKALTYAYDLTPLAVAVHVASDPERAAKLQKKWKENGIMVPLEIVESPYRATVQDLLSYLDQLEKCPDFETIILAIPEFVPERFWQNFLHNQTGQMMKLLLLLNKNILVTSIPYHPPTE